MRQWMENIANQLYQDLQSEINPYTRVEDTDKDLPTILVSKLLPNSI